MAINTLTVVYCFVLEAYNFALVDTMFRYEF